MADLAATIEATLAGSWRRDSRLHGDEHWRCVAATGLELAAAVPATDRRRILLFGLLHDTRRENDRLDPGHGGRASIYARDLHAAGHLDLADAHLQLLCHACELHSSGQVSTEPTVGVCWDADRLHLPRVGIAPDPDPFSTPDTRAADQLVAAGRTRSAVPTWQELIASTGRP